MKNTTKVICPKCGTEFEIPETSHIAVGLVIGRDSGLGVIHPKVAGENNNETAAQAKDGAAAAPVNKAQARIDALKAAGVDTSNLFAVNSASGETSVGRLENGSVSIVEDDDPIFRSIMNGDTIPERRLFRRWVMSQMFHMLASPEGFNKALQDKGYEYSWKMLIEELRVQVKLEKNDTENYEQRHRWFNAEVASAMANDYINKLKEYVKQLPEKHCKGVAYKRIHGKDFFITDLDKKVYEPLKKAANQIALTDNTKDLLTSVARFNRLRFKLHYDTRLSSAFVAAYKGSGAYFTLKNLILFHGCALYKGCIKQSQNWSLVQLDVQAEVYNHEGWKMFAMMNKVIKDNGLDIKKKMSEWSGR